MDRCFCISHKLPSKILFDKIFSGIMIFDSINFFHSYWNWKHFENEILKLYMQECYGKETTLI